MTAPIPPQTVEITMKGKQLIKKSHAPDLQTTSRLVGMLDLGRQSISPSQSDTKYQMSNMSISVKPVKPVHYSQHHHSLYPSPR